ncbi:hypothetical protein LCGC14_2258710 [marine sediment metagenome]|uniref:Uncharacterized protein n=1 Tax=marine sediment metagenome TaxID=412755 RepID=A0A0F9D0B5_9ZZZZ
MSDPATELAGLQLLYGRSIPPLPRQPRIAQRTVRWDTTLDEYAQRAANDRRYGYDGDVTALIRHAVSLFIMALAGSSGQDVSPIRFQMEMLRQQQEGEEFTAFTDYAQTTIREAEEYTSTMAGRGRAATLLGDLVGVLRRHPTPAMRLRMQSYLTGNGRFVKMVKNLGSEALKAWLELAT